MSASLVGSEMCIRDRCGPGVATLASCRPQLCSGGRGGRPQTGGNELGVALASSLERPIIRDLARVAVAVRLRTKLYLTSCPRGAGGRGAERGTERGSPGHRQRGH
eukprot:14649845-Alexandrium_andersonii.AAC.1